MPVAGNKNWHRGVTLIELVIVLGIIGLLTTMVMPRFTGSDATLMAQAHRFASDLRHIQAMAMNQGRSIVIDIQSVKTYRAAFGGGTVTNPATMQPFSVTLENNVRINGPDTGFDTMGRPIASSGLLDAERVYDLSGTSKTVSVVLSPVTGFVAVSP